MLECSACTYLKCVTCTEEPKDAKEAKEAKEGRVSVKSASGGGASDIEDLTGSENEVAKILDGLVNSVADQGADPIPPPGLQLPSAIEAEDYLAIVESACIQNMLTKWIEQPPEEKGGWYESTNAKLKWSIHGKRIKLWAPLRDMIHYLHSKGTLCPRFNHCFIESMSVMWTDGNGYHTDKPVTCPDGLAVLSLPHIKLDPLTPGTRSYHVNFRRKNALPDDAGYTMEVPEGCIYSLEQDALKTWKHSVIMDDSLGKVAIRLGFRLKEEEPTQLVREMGIYMDGNAKKAKLPREAAIEVGELKDTQTKNRRTSPRKHAAPIKSAPRSSTSGSTTQKIPVPPQASTEPTPSKYPLPAQEMIDTLAKLLSTPKYWNPNHVYHTNPKKRMEMVEDVRKMRLLSFDSRWGKDVAAPAGNFPPTGIQGALWGGEFFSNQREASACTKFMWSLMKTHKEAMGNWGHDKEVKAYMQKMVIHVEAGKGRAGDISTVAQDCLQGRTERDFALLKGGKTLTDFRKRQILNVTSNRIPFLAGAKKKPLPLSSKSEAPETYDHMQHLLKLATSKLPPELKAKNYIVFDITIMASTANTPPHADEIPQIKKNISGDGTGLYIMNLCVNADGLFVLQNSHHAVDKEKEPLMGVYVGFNHFTMFGEGSHLEATHQVLRLEIPKLLKLSSSKPSPVFFFQSG
jgi:hypothetical protein